MKSNLDATPERKEEIMNECIAALIRREELAKALISNTEYILWLENFTVVNPSFEEDSWLYYPEKISKEDSERVNELCCFFNGITKYADQNFIPVHYSDFDTYVFVKFNNIGYKIGIISGQGSFAYCERVDISADNSFINFNDVINNKKQENVDYIREKLNSISSIIEELLKMG